MKRSGAAPARRPRPPGRGGGGRGGDGDRGRGGARTPTEPLVATVERRGRLLVAEPLFERGRRHALDGRARNGAGEGELVLVGFGNRGTRVVRRLGARTSRATCSRA